MNDITCTSSCCSFVLAFVQLENALFNTLLQCTLIEHAIFQAKNIELDKSISFFAFSLVMVTK